MKHFKKLFAQFRMSSSEQEKTWRGIIEKTGLHKPRVYERYIFRFAMAAFGVLALVGSPVAYAAEQSLPGDVLYSVKTDALEVIKEKILIREVSRAEYQKKLIAKREFELKTLEEGKDKNVEKVKKAQAQLQKQEKKIEKKIERLEKKGKVKAVKVLRDVQKNRKK